MDKYRQSIGLERHISLIETKEVAQICQPLFEQFGLNYFTYARIYNSKELLILTSHKAFAKYIYKNQLNFINIIEQNLEDGGYFWSQYQNKLTEEIIKHYDIDHCFTLVEKYENHINICDFGAPQKHGEIINFYLNNLDVLKHFINYFNEKAVNLIKIMAKHRITIQGKIKNQQMEVFDNRKATFLEETKLKGFTINNLNAHLGKRELECFMHILHGRTALEISTKINISVKTVEWYIQSLKAKLRCNKRSDLFEIAKRLGILEVAYIL